MSAVARPEPPAPLRVGAVVLAAGAGARMGHRPKGTLLRDGVPLLRGIYLSLQAAGAAPVVVVLGHHAAALRPVLQGLAVQEVLNPAPQTGPVGSQRLGLAALPAGLDAVLIALADQPLLEAQDVRAVLDAWHRRAAGVRWLQPTVDGLPGHPVVIDAGVRDEVLATGPDQGPRQWRQAHPDAVACWGSDNRHYVTDLDTEDDIGRLARAHGIELRWP